MPPPKQLTVSLQKSDWLFAENTHDAVSGILHSPIQAALPSLLCPDPGKPALDTSKSCLQFDSYSKQQD